MLAFRSALAIFLSFADACYAEERRIDPTLERIAKGFTPERKSSFDEIAKDRLVQDGFLGAFRL